MINRKKKLSLMVALLSLACTGLEAQNVWKGTWATAVEKTGKKDMPKESLSNRSCRRTSDTSRSWH